MQPQVGRIGDANDQIRCGFAGIVAFADIACDLLVRAVRIETVGARQIEQLQHAARGRNETALLALDRDTGIVGHLLSAAGKQVEQRSLAAVGVTHQGNTQGTGAHTVSTCTLTRAASLRRSAKRVDPICTSRGSAPNGPRATSRTGSPCTKPRSRRRCAIGSSAWASSTWTTTAAAPFGKSDRRTNDDSNKNGSHCISWRACWETSMPASKTLRYRDLRVFRQH